MARKVLFLVGYAYCGLLNQSTKLCSIQANRKFLRVQEWSNDDYATKQLIPFKDLPTFRGVIGTLGLSLDYPYLFRHSEFVAPTIVTITDARSNADITCNVSPVLLLAIILIKT
jgi:hypothetical protein